MLCVMENVLGVKVACLWLCLDCVSCEWEFEIAFVPYFEANLRSCAQNSISNRLIVAYNLIDLIGLMRQQPNLCSEIR